MAILGVLLGITMTVLAGLPVWYFRENKALVQILLSLEEKISLLTDRVSHLERRKSVISEAVASQPKPQGVGVVRPRTWSEDTAQFEVAK